MYFMPDNFPVHHYSTNIDATGDIIAAPGAGFRLGLSSMFAEVYPAQAGKKVAVADEDGGTDIVSGLSIATAGEILNRNYHPGIVLLPENKALKATTDATTGEILFTGCYYLVVA